MNQEDRETCVICQGMPRMVAVQEVMNACSGDMLPYANYNGLRREARTSLLAEATAVLQRRAARLDAQLPERPYHLLYALHSQVAQHQHTLLCTCTFVVLLACAANAAVAQPMQQRLTRCCSI